MADEVTDAAANASAAGPSHEAFPTAESYGGKADDSLPKDETELWALVESTTLHQDIRSRLLPVLGALALEGQDRPDQQRLLSVPSFDIRAATDEQVRAHTIALIYVV